MSRFQGNAGLRLGQLPQISAWRAVKHIDSSASQSIKRYSSRPEADSVEYRRRQVAKPRIRRTRMESR